MFRNICAKAGLDPGEWTPRELRHSFVSLMSDAGVPLEEIARLVGHGSTKVTETVYRKQLRPVLTGGAQVMDTLFDLPQVEGRDLSRGELVPQLVPQRHEKSPSACSAEGLYWCSDLRICWWAILGLNFICPGSGDTGQKWSLGL